MTAARILKHCGAARNTLGFWECDAAHCPFAGQLELVTDHENCDYPQESDDDEHNSPTHGQAAELNRRYGR